MCNTCDLRSPGVLKQDLLQDALWFFSHPQIVLLFGVIPPQTEDICSLLFEGLFFSLCKSGVLCLSSGVAPLLHPALLHCIFLPPPPLSAEGEDLGEPGVN